MCSVEGLPPLFARVVPPRQQAATAVPAATKQARLDMVMAGHLLLVRVRARSGFERSES
jgi:hypothetical protein